MLRNLPKSNFFIVVMMLFAFVGNANAASFTISTNVTYSATYAGGDITIANGGAFTINNDAQIKSITVNGNGTLIVNSPYTLTIGVSGNAATLQVVDFNNNSIVTINSGAILLVYGLLNNSNNSTGITFNGTVTVNGNVTVGNGSTVDGSGSLTSTGSITGAGTVFGSGNDCLTGPCSGGNLCSFTNSISNNQIVCSNTIPAPLTSSTNASLPAYQWQSSSTSGGGFANISGAISPTYAFSSALSQTTYYRLKITSGSCTSFSSQVRITVNNELPNNTSSTGFTGATICVGGSPQLTFDAIDSSFSTPYSITYKNDATSIQYTTSIPNASLYSFTPGDNPTSNATYTLVSISNASCTRTTGFGNSGANLIVRPIPTTTISGTTSLCLGATSPNVVFTNPQTAIITVTYTINGGTSQTIDVAAESFTNVPVSTATANTFVYNLVSVMYKTSICSNAISGSATVTINALPTTPLTTIIQPNCTTATGTIVVTVQSATDTYSFDNGVNYQASNTMSGLPPANYSIVIKNSAGCISPVTNVGIIASTTKTWNGTSWTPSTPTINDSANFASGTYTSTGDLAICSCQVTGATVVINSGHTLNGN